MSARSKGGCGCGGGGGGAAAVATAGCGCGGGCGCGAKDGAACIAGTIERPLFFGGQLLTEDNLQDLVDYVVAKNRLHNRALFGDGVVCGLDVTCDPCGAAKIVVRPGYALDCCGNDISVDCAVTLDVNQMIRDLRQKRLGQECGDPCKKEPTGGEETVVPDPGTSTGETIGTFPPPAAPPEQAFLYGRLARGCKDVEGELTYARTEEYYLYIRYCETQTEPVAPYATDDCSPSSCQPTRTREGYRFELRCRTACKPPHTIADRIRDCVRDLRAKPDMTAKAAILYRTFRAVEVGARLAGEGEAIEFSAQDRESLGAASEALRARLALKSGPSEGDLVAGIHDLIEVGALMARAHLAAGDLGKGPKPEDGKARLLKVGDGSLLHAGAAYYQGHLDSIKEPFAHVLAEEAVSYFSEPLERRLASNPMQARMLANGGLVTDRMIEAAREPAAELRRMVLAHVSRGGHTRCGLREDVMRLPTFQSEEKPTIGFIGKGFDRQRTSIIARGVAGVSRFYVDSYLGCFCDALNPPCADCDDQAVLLACIKWEDCKVVEICNLVRKWVITGPNLRYWLPWLGELGENWERACCLEPCDDPFADRFGRASQLDSIVARGGRPALRELPEFLQPGLRKVLTGEAASIAKPFVAAAAGLGAADEKLAALQARHEDLLARLATVEAKLATKADVKPAEARPEGKKR